MKLINRRMGSRETHFLKLLQLLNLLHRKRIKHVLKMLQLLKLLQRQSLFFHKKMSLHWNLPLLKRRHLHQILRIWILLTCLYLRMLYKLKITMSLQLLRHIRHQRRTIFCLKIRRTNACHLMTQHHHH
uniref:Uncharacterized protein n=1 Tax=Opuntia streptacantha TaxID=393608 RepID=A0A7C9AEG1_OPUST